MPGSPGKSAIVVMSSQPLKLVFPGGEHPQVLLGHGANWVGSDPGASIVLDRPGVRPQHCELQVGAHGVILRMPPGTVVQVNGKAVDGVIALRPGDEVGFEQVRARLVEIATGTALGRAAADAPANDDASATVVRPALPHYVLRGVSGALLGRHYPVAGETVLGRSPECTLCIDAKRLSRSHARLTPMTEGLRVYDMDSTNGTFINGRRVRVGTARPGDEIAFDDLRFQLLAPRRSLHRAQARPEAEPLRQARRPAWSRSRIAAATLVPCALAGAVAFWFLR